MGKKSYSNTAVIFVFLDFYFFLVFFLKIFLNKQPAAAILLRYIIYVVVA